ncbi:hypothetical protein [Tunturiibacter gelidiferens]|uniref:hypothetical protein n=1 Tax=Tunturiibacter gelidiferens TaxID=3069689 RepID=UPI003D9ABCE6
MRCRRARNAEPGTARRRRPVAHLSLAASAEEAGNAPTTISLFNQGLIQVLEAAVSGLQPKQSYELVLAENPDDTGALQPLQPFKANPLARRSSTPSVRSGSSWRAM